MLSSCRASRARQLYRRLLNSCSQIVATTGKDRNLHVFTPGKTGPKSVERAGPRNGTAGSLAHRLPDWGRKAGKSAPLSVIQGLCFRRGCCEEIDTSQR